MNLLTIQLNKNDKIYLQIYEAIRQQILSNNIKANEKLPSKRKLANHLNVSLSTICNAYSLLIEEGYITSIEKKGYYALSYNINTTNSLAIKPINTNLDYSYLYDFTTKNIDKDSFPFYTWNKLSKSILYNDPSILSRMPSKGFIGLRNEISRYLEETRNMLCNPENIIIGSSIEYLLTILCHILNCDTYCLENPGYKKIATILENNHKTIKYANIDASGICLNELEASLAKVVYVTPSNQFPTGKKMNMSRKIELIGWAKDNRYIIEDDFDSEFRIFGKPSTTLYSLNAKSTIFLSNFSRTLAPSIRLAYMVLPDSLAKVYDAYYLHYSSSVSTLEQLVITSFIKDGFYFRHLNKMRNIYRTRRQRIISFLEEYSFLEINTVDSYLSLLVNIKGSYDPVVLASIFEKESLNIKFLSDYGRVKDNMLIIGYSAINDDILVDGLNTLIKCIKQVITY